MLSPNPLLEFNQNFVKLRQIKKTFVLLFFSLIFSQATFQVSYAQEQKLSPELYLQEVSGKSLNYLGANKSLDAFDLLKEKAKLVTAVKLYAYSEKSFAEQVRTTNLFTYKSLNNQTNRIGLKQDSEFGLSTDIHYTLLNNRYQGMDVSRFGGNPLATQNYQTIPGVELSFPLWQNRFGSTTRATKDSVYFENESQKLSAKALSVGELVDAEKTYWALVYARKEVEIQKRALEGAQRILDYVTRKEKMNLGEKGDVLQAQALFETKKLFLQQSLNNEKITTRNFNKKRNLTSDTVEEKLENFNLTQLQKFLIQQIKTSDRLDVKAKEAQMKSAIAAAKIEEENNKPSLKLYASYSANQVGLNSNQVINNSFTANGRAGKIGVELLMPVNFGLTSTIRKGAIYNTSAAKINYRQQLLEQEIDWQLLVQNLQNLQENLQLSLAIETAQKSKLENERRLLKQGRTSTYQVLLFEQEFSNAELNTQQIAYKIHELLAQQKLYK